MIINKITKSFILFLLAGSIFPVHANWYQVEVIIFEHISPNADGEIWKQDPGMPSYDDVIELYEEEEAVENELQAEGEITEPSEPILGSETLEVAETAEAMELVDEPTMVEDGPIPFLPLPEENYRLEGVYRVLKLSRDYRPLQHIAWQQPALEAQVARSVHLKLNEEIENPADELPPELADIQLEDELEVLEELGEAIFDGFLRVRSSLYLHVDLDMRFFPEMFRKEEGEIAEIVATEVRLQEDELLFQTEPKYVRLKESRKIKLNEMHYFDHPTFGVIVQVSRIEVETEEVAGQ